MAEKIRIKPEWDNLAKRSTEALNAGMTYGKYMGMLYSAQQDRMDAQRRAEEARRKEREARGQNEDPSGQRNYVNTCDYCGKPVTGKRKFCDGRCKYLFNQEAYKERAMRDYQRKKCLKNEAGNRVCMICGKEILGNLRKYYCSDECAREGRIARRREERAAKRSERKKDE